MTVARLSVRSGRPRASDARWVATAAAGSLEALSLSTWVCGFGRRSGARLAGDLHLRLEDVPSKGDDPCEDEVVQRVLLRAQVGRGRASGERGCLL